MFLSSLICDVMKYMLYPRKIAKTFVLQVVDTIPSQFTKVFGTNRIVSNSKIVKL